MRTFFTIIIFLTFYSLAHAQKFNVGILLMPQQSLYSYSNSYAPEQIFSTGLAAGITASYNATGYYGIELQSLYSFEKHDYDLPTEINFSETNNYIKIALLNNFYSFNPDARCRLVIGFGPQVSILTQANVRMEATDKIINLYDISETKDVGFACKVGLAVLVKDALLNLGLRYDRGFLDITPDVPGKVFNNTLGFCISVAANK